MISDYLTYLQYIYSMLHSPKKKIISHWRGQLLIIFQNWRKNY